MTQGIPPEILASIQGLSLLAKTVVDGFLTGLNQGRVKGVGMEFNQYRPYQMGDDLRFVDWKLVGRSDKYFVRESEIETNLSVRFIIDNTSSMLHTEKMKDGKSTITKFQYAKFLAASLAYLAYSQGDALSLYAVHKDVETHLPLLHHSKKIHLFLHSLQSLEANGIFEGWNNLESIYPLSKHKELIIFITDLYQFNNEIIDSLMKFTVTKNEVLVCHLMGIQEKEFEYTGDVLFEDLETEESLLVDTESVRSNIRLSVETHLNQLERKLRQEGIAYHQFIIQEALDAALREFLNTRRKLT